MKKIKLDTTNVSVVIACIILSIIMLLVILGINRLQITKEVSAHLDIITVEPVPTEEPIITEFITCYDVPISDEDVEFVKEVCSYYSFEEELIYKIMAQESRFDSKAISKTNDHGIMQLNARWYKGYLNIDDGFSYIYSDGYDIYNIKHNVILAIRQMDYWRKQCQSRGYTSTVSMLECYNRGFSYFNNTSYANYSSKVLSQQIPTKQIEVIITRDS